MHTILQPEGWAKPIGYANGMAATGRMVFVGGQVGWNAACEFESDDFVEQVRQTLMNVVAILAEGGAEAAAYHLDDLVFHRQERIFGQSQGHRPGLSRDHRPALSGDGRVQVVALVEDRAKIEIQATAVIPE